MSASQVIRAAAELYIDAVRALGSVDSLGQIHISTSAGVVMVAVSASAAGIVTLSHIAAHNPGRGAGTGVMLTLVNLAETCDVVLELVCVPLGHKGNQYQMRSLFLRLKAWYERFGFQGGAYNMRRRPLSMRGYTR